jgi:hypothetical protein
MQVSMIYRVERKILAHIWVVLSGVEDLVPFMFHHSASVKAVTASVTGHLAMIYNIGDFSHSKLISQIL